MFSINLVHLAMAQSNHTKTKSGFLAQNRTWFTSLITYVSVLFPALLVKKGDPPPNRATPERRVLQCGPKGSREAGHR